MPELAQYGFLGTSLLALAGYLVRQDALHRKERDDWRRIMEKQGDESSKHMQQNTSILSELKTLINTMKR